MAVFAIQGSGDNERLEESSLYGVTLQGKPVGFFSQSILLNTRLNEVLVKEVLTIQTNNRMPYIQSKSYFFNADPPRSLLRAGKQIMRFELLAMLTYKFDPSKKNSEKPLLFNELLRGTDKNLTPNSSHTYKHLGREMSGIVETKWTVRSESDAVVHSTEPMENTLIIDDIGRIQRVKTGGIEYILIEDQFTHQRWKDSIKAPFETSLEVPVIGVIPNPRNVAFLKLKFESNETNRTEWDAYLDSKRVFDSSTFKRVRRDEGVPIQVPHVRGGALDQQLRSLANRIPESGSPLERVQSLVTLVNGFLDYEDLDYSPDLPEILQTREGDCTEFAKLYDALSDYMGWNSNIVYGLVYEATSHTFRPHAWNEVEIDGYWVGVDPTFRQTVLDATHIPFPNGNHAALINDLFHTEFHVLEVRNRS